MSRTATTPPLDASPLAVVPDTSRADARFARILGSRGAAISFAVIVFAATALQVLITPLAALIGGHAQWTLSLPPEVVIPLVILGCAVQAGSLALGSRHPIIALCGTVLAYVAVIAFLGVPAWLPGMQLVVAIALFFLGARSSSVVTVAGFLVTGVVGVGTLAWSASTTGVPFELAYGFVVQQGVAFLAPAAGGAALGAWWGVQSRRVARERAEAETLRQEHLARIDEARANERVRIAQELHDVASQHIAGLLALTDAARAVAAADTAHTTELLDEVRAEGRFAAASLYGAISELRAVDTAPALATPDVRDVPRLLERWARRGVSADLRVTGDLEALPAVISTTAYRGVQEAIVNAAKHAPGATAQVVIAFDGVTLHATIVNGPAVHERQELDRYGLGLGIDGLRERLRLLDGTLEATPTATGGWRVHLSVPIPTTTNEGVPHA